MSQSEIKDFSLHILVAGRVDGFSQLLDEQLDELRARLGRRSREVSQRYDIRQVVKSYEAILLEALAESRAESAMAGAS